MIISNSFLVSSCTCHVFFQNAAAGSLPEPMEEALSLDVPITVSDGEGGVVQDIPVDDFLPIPSF